MPSVSCASARAGPDKDVGARGLEFYESFEISDVKVHLCALWWAESVRRSELCRLELIYPYCAFSGVNFTCMCCTLLTSAEEPISGPFAE